MRLRSYGHGVEYKEWCVVQVNPNYYVAIPITHLGKTISDAVVKMYLTREEANTWIRLLNDKR